jgi:transitional endoplasmic reticulum ATPase
MIEELNLRVAEAYHKDVGRGFARIDTRLMQQMGLVSGDVIEISGKAKTYALVLPNVEHEQEKIIRIDGNGRSNSKVGIDDRVTIKKNSGKTRSESYSRSFPACEPCWGYPLYP